MEMEIHVTSMCGKYDYMLLTGDTCKSHTANLPNYIHGDPLLVNHFGLDNYTCSLQNQIVALPELGIQTNRHSTDTKKNQAGNKLIDICKK